MRQYFIPYCMARPQGKNEPKPYRVFRVEMADDITVLIKYSSDTKRRSRWTLKVLTPYDLGYSRLNLDHYTTDRLLATIKKLGISDDQLYIDVQGEILQ